MSEPQNPNPQEPEGGKPTGEDNSGLKKALDAERQARKELEKQLKAITETEAKRQQEAEEAKARATGDFEKLKADYEAKTKAALDRADALEAKFRNGHRDRAAMEAIVAAGGIPDALMPFVTASLEVVAEGEDYKVLVKGNPGTKITDFVASLKQDKPWGFQPTGANGGGAPHAPGKPQVSQPTTSHELITAGLKQIGFGK